ncbi:MAG: Conserved hypothetical rane protein [Burkholderiales bacterium]|jgi:uncharacterized integral membrane protein (TIGR00697 family)|nr:Conserved hypothetical rane protein [Burkholderiales bacterium]
MNIPASNQPKYQYKYLIFMSVFYFLGWVVSYPVVYKLIYIHHVLESSATLLFPLSYAVADIITEVYGYKVARQVVWAGVICGLIFSIALQLISYIPSASPNGDSYYVVFGHITRIYASITLGSLIGNFLNIYFISKFKVRFSGRFFWARSIFSTAIGELTFTIIAGIMVWAGIQTWSKLAVLLLNAYLFKIIYALVATGPAAFIARYLKKIEHSDAYDVGIDYNPFKLNVD